jgi:hypothetical protein
MGERIGHVVGFDIGGSVARFHEPYFVELKETGGEFKEIGGWTAAGNEADSSQETGSRSEHGGTDREPEEDSESDDTEDG